MKSYHFCLKPGTKPALSTGVQNPVVCGGLPSITAKLEPNDVDIVLVVQDDFREQDYDPDVFPMFDHRRAQRELGASMFVIRPAFLFGETVDDFIAHWQITRDMSRRGIVEVLAEEAV